MNPQVKKNPFKNYFQPFSAVVVCLLLSAAIAESKPYAVPSPPDILEQRVVLVEPQGVLSLTEALSLALLHNPTLQDFAWDIRISDVKTLRASLISNPELAIEAENFLGSGQQHNFNQTETMVSVSQLFELGGKRGKR